MNSTLPNRARNLRAGYTLIEMIAVITILAMLAALIVPNMVAARDAASRQRFLADFRGFLSSASAQAARSNQTLEVYIESDEVHLRSTGEEQQDLRAITLYPGATLESFTLNGQDVAESEWLPRFFPDGQARGGTAQLNVDGKDFVVRIESNGRTSVFPGLAEDQDQSKWNAGDLEQRL